MPKSHSARTIFPSVRDAFLASNKAPAGSKYHVMPTSTGPVGYCVMIHALDEHETFIGYL